MARRKASSEPTVPETAPVISAEEAVNEERQRIADERTSQFLGETVVDNKVVEDKETAAPAKKEEPTLTGADVEKKIETPTFDPKKMEETITARVSDEVAKKVTNALGKERTTQEQKDKYQEAAEDFYKKNGRNPQWHELVPYMVDDAVKLIEAKQEERKQQIAEQQRQAAQTNEQKQKQFNQYVDEQMEDLFVAGKIARDDEAAKTELFKTMIEVNTKRAAVGKPPIYSVKEIYYEHYTAPKSQPAGADAPISAGRGNAQVGPEEEIDYREIKKPWSSFFKR